MSLVDLTQRLDYDTPAYPGDPRFSRAPHLTIGTGGCCNVDRISMSSHSGTHMDAPKHFITDGKAIDQLPLEMFIARRAVVVDVRNKQPRERITWEDVAHHESSMGSDAVVLFNTGWSQYWETEKYFRHPYIDNDVACRILAAGVRIIGIDALSPDETRTDGTLPSYAVHETLLGAECLIVENLTSLDDILGRHAVVTILPLKIAGCDGSPVRAIAQLS